MAPVSGINFISTFLGDKNASLLVDTQLMASFYAR